MSMKPITLVEHERVKVVMKLNRFTVEKTGEVKKTLDIRYMSRDRLDPEKWGFTKKGIGLNEEATIKLINSLQDHDIVAKIIKHFEED